MRPSGRSAIASTSTPLPRCTVATTFGRAGTASTTLTVASWLTYAVRLPRISTRSSGPGRSLLFTPRTVAGEVVRSSETSPWRSPWSGSPIRASARRPFAERASESTPPCPAGTDVGIPGRSPGAGAGAADDVATPATAASAAMVRARPHMRAGRVTRAPPVDAAGGGGQRQEVRAAAQIRRLPRPVVRRAARWRGPRGCRRRRRGTASPSRRRCGGGRSSAPAWSPDVRRSPRGRRSSLSRPPTAAA